MAEDYSTFLTESENLQLCEEYLAKHLGANGKLTYKKPAKKGNGKVYQYKNGKNINSVHIYQNPDKLPGYTYAVMVIYEGGTSTNVNTKSMIVELGGNYWEEKQLQRLAEHRGEEYKARKPKISEEEQKRIDEARAAEKAKADFEAERKAMLINLTGATMAQFIYLASKAKMDPIYHASQTVKTVSQHPYPKNKRIEITPNDDFYIITPHIPSTAQVLKFLQSDKFTLPENSYGLTAKDIIEHIQNPETQFNTENYISPADARHGNGIIPSRDKNGTVVNLQKFYTKKINGVDKMFMADGIVVNSYYFFDHERKLKPDFKPNQIIITEGWATGRSINEALKKGEGPDDYLVVVCWNAGQLSNAVKSITLDNPDAQITIAADNDYKSFGYMDRDTEEKRLTKVRNTGLLETIRAINNLPEEHQNRVSAIIPNVDFTQFKHDKFISDFNDIELSKGTHECVKLISEEINHAAVRKENGVSEVDHLVQIYNKQANHFANLYNVEVRGVDATGELSIDNLEIFRTLNRNSIEFTAKETTAVATAEKFDLNSFMNFSDTELVKTEYDKKKEHEAELLSKPIEPTLNVTTRAPAEVEVHAEPQPMINTALFTAFLSETLTQSTFSDVVHHAENTHELEIGTHVLQPETKMLGAIVDPVMSKHIIHEIKSNTEKYKDQPFYDQLVSITNGMPEEFVVYTTDTQNMIKDNQRYIANAYISSHYHVGLDDKTADQIFKSEITQLEHVEKQNLFKELRSTLRNLNESDTQWISKLSTMIDIAKESTAVVQQTREAPALEKSESPSPMI